MVPRILARRHSLERHWVEASVKVFMFAFRTLNTVLLSAIRLNDIVKSILLSFILQLVFLLNVILLLFVILLSVIM
jgi:hypothetical protein